MKETCYLLVCRKCGNGDLVMPFGTAEERGKWAAEHTRGTGHDSWWVRDQVREGREPGNVATGPEGGASG